MKAFLKRNASLCFILSIMQFFLGIAWFPSTCFAASAGAHYASVADYLLKLGKDYYTQERYADALHELKKALLVKPDCPEARHYISLIEKERSTAGAVSMADTYDVDEPVAADPFWDQDYFSEDDAVVVYETPDAVNTTSSSSTRSSSNRQAAIADAFDDVEKRLFPAVAPVEERSVQATSAPVYTMSPDDDYTKDRPDRRRFEINKALNNCLQAPERALNAVKEKLPPKYHMSGEYQVAVGVVGSEDNAIEWNNADGNDTETDSRFLFSGDNVNSFDRRIYDRFRVNLDIDQTENLKVHTNITVDPWSFVGKSDKVTLTSVWGDTAEVELKSWANTHSLYPEKVYTLDGGDSFIVPEMEIVDGKTQATTVTTTFGNTFTIPAVDIEQKYFLMRELWVDYETDQYKLRLFPIAYEDQALTSDDPLGLSNHHIYWEPSPWVYEWKPGHLNTTPTPDDFTSGKWSDALIYGTRDSDLLRLNSLRGVALSGDVTDNLSFNSTVAAAKTLWQDYDSVSSVPAALRVKYEPTDQLTLGSVGTFLGGFSGGSLDATNAVVGVDAAYDITPEITVSGEVALSQTVKNKTEPTYELTNEGDAYHLGVDAEYPLSAKDSSVTAGVSFTHMDSGFETGLANYRNTRQDQFWSRHIHFDQPANYYDIKPFALGNGVDYGRNAFNMNLGATKLWEGDLDVALDSRYVRSTEGKYVEGVLRNEMTYRFNPRLRSKLLLLYHDLPDTIAGYDPFAIDAETGDALQNTAIEGGKDPSLGTASAGLEYEVNDWLTVEGIYERTNDFHVATGNFPNGLLNWSSFTTTNINGEVYRIGTYGLYSQNYFDLPPYNYFNTYKCKATLTPIDRLMVELEYTKNDFKYAGPIDDNLNHFGLGVRYNFTDRLTGLLKYTYSHWNDLYDQQVLSDEVSFNSHHNVFAELNYTVTENSEFIMQFGEGNIASAYVGATGSPFSDALPTLDTRQILRVYFKGRF